MFAKFYQSLICLGKVLQPFLLLAIRLFWGYLFFQAGVGKLQNIDITVEFFRNIHIPWPTFSAYLVAIVEALGGIMLTLGFGARLAAIPLIITMIFAFTTTNMEPISKYLENPELITREAPFNFLFASLIIFVFGPGLFSLDAIGKKIWGRCCRKDKEVVTTTTTKSNPIPPPSDYKKEV